MRRGLGPCTARGETRFLDCSISGLRVLTAYVPNGKAPSHPDWRYKLAWLAALLDHLEAAADPGMPLVLCGDFNVAPTDRDSASPNPAGVLCHPEARSALARLTRFGLHDAYRLRYAEGQEPLKGIYTWWDYTRLSFARNDGARIDHIYLTAALSDRLRAVFVDRDERRQKKGQDIPSDHAPVICDLAVRAPAASLAPHRGEGGPPANAAPGTGANAGCGQGPGAGMLRHLPWQRR